MGKECGAWLSRCLWGGRNMNPLKMTVWEAMLTQKFVDSQMPSLVGIIALSNACQYRTDLEDLSLGCA